MYGLKKLSPHTLLDGVTGTLAETNELFDSRGVLWAVGNLQSSPIKHHSKSWSTLLWQTRGRFGQGNGDEEIAWKATSSPPHSDNVEMYLRDLDRVR